jgi:hypothetical protein
VPRTAVGFSRRLKEFSTGKLFSVQPLFWELTMGERRRFPVPAPCSIFVWLAARQRLSRIVIQVRRLIIGSCTALCRFMLRMLYRPDMADTCSIQAGQPASDAAALESWKCRQASCMARLNLGYLERRGVGVWRYGGGTTTLLRRLPQYSV